MKLTVKIIKGIPVGETSKFKVDSPRAINTARMLAGYINRMYPENGIRYTYKSNFETNEVSITATAIEK